MVKGIYGNRVVEEEDEVEGRVLCIGKLVSLNITSFEMYKRPE